ncbi:caspase, EACC1-associated type [Actinokineospora enzanensis]|uniref:caspase, EACC1-associated type n=1 Tax=Actinokineospora enzanensis TaxID=155975 RepID=UPI00037E9A0A|nr:AAA domain-containing protein [Actinokineospora enzanensis]
MSGAWFPTAGRSRAVLIGAGDYDSPALAAIPAVVNNLSALRETLTDSTRGVFEPAHCAVAGLHRPTSVAEVGSALGKASREAVDLLLVYYAGHGLLDSGGDLHLALHDTEPDNAAYSSLAVSRIKQDLGQAAARVRVLILDSCFSGQAISAMAGPEALVAGQLQLNGTYTLTSSPATRPSAAPPGERHTAFTGALLRALAAPKPLTLDEIYQSVRTELLGLGLPEPQRRGTNNGERLALVRGAGKGGSSEPPPPPPHRRRGGLLEQVLDDANRQSVVLRRARADRTEGARTFSDAGTDAGRARVVEFWRAVEMFSPQKVKRVNKRELRVRVVPGEPLPWQPEHELASRKLTDKQVWRHMVYLGVHQIEPVFDILHSVFAPDETSYDERPGGESALAAFAVAQDGRAIVDSQVLSTCAWATGRLLNPGPDAPGWLTGFDGVRREFDRLFAGLTGPDSDKAGPGNEDGPPVDDDLLAYCLQMVEDLVRLGAAVPHGEIRIESMIVSKRNAHGADGLDFLNSMIVEDLVTVADRIREGTASTALRAFLRPEAQLDPTARVDVRTRLDEVLDAVAPARLPLGRWPADPAHALALGQQLAVARCASTADEPGGVLGVNGPPGTGKTTMLRDLVAGLVVRRATALAGLRRPDDAFTGDTDTWQTGDYTRRLYRLVPGITGHEMVVASANNGAVENVTDEMPARDAIDDSWRAAAAAVDYFPGIGSALLGTEERGASEGAGWALLAARLGNKANRGTFVSAFWYGPRDGRPGMRVILKRYEESGPERAWAEAVADFRRALAAAESGQSTRQRAYEAMREIPVVTVALGQSTRDFAAAERRVAEVRQLQQAAHDTGLAWDQELGRQVDLRKVHQGSKPGFLERLMSWGRVTREWRAADSKIVERIQAADHARGAARQEVTRLSGIAEQQRVSAARAAEAMRHAQARLDAANEEVSRARARYGDHFPGDGWHDDRDRRELAAPWNDPEWNGARTELFLAALRLHKEFLQHTASKLRKTLHGAVDILEGSAPRDIPAAAALTAWQALFLVVPVVSTTFSSFARMFRHLTAESLGWLLIDEAGQAPPQSAVGALWRSRHAVIVGDPLQLEPICGVPFPAEQAIRNEFGVAPEWLTGPSSVQQLADRVTRWGTTLHGEDEDIWVGAPLTVHRRCQEPMFGIANDIAYDGTMIHAADPRGAAAFDARYPSLPASKWIDVVGESAGRHWIPAEGEQLETVLKALDNLGFPMSEVMVIAPFREVSNEVRKAAGRYTGMVAGTIHTAQGKQADIVVLVLGGNPTQDGARAWAAGSPNLVNVAASRAKYRLYVIGNRALWSRHRYFSVMSERLPYSSPGDRRTNR